MNQDNDFFDALAQSFEDSVEDIEYDDNSPYAEGLILRDREPSEPNPDAASEPAKGEDTQGTPGSRTSQPADPSSWESRYKEAQGWGTRLSQENASLRERLARLEGLAEARGILSKTEDAPAGMSEEELASILEDPKRLEDYVERRFEDFQKRGTAAQRRIRESVQSELEEARASIPGFSEAEQDVGAVIRAFPQSNLTFRDAFMLLKWGEAIEAQALEQAGGPAQATRPQAGQPNQPANPATRRLPIRPETGASAVNDDLVAPQSPVTSIDDAMNRALEEMTRE